MNLYGMIFGQNPASVAILHTLGLTRDDFGRFRDAGVEPGRIYIYTRCGGGNREDYQRVFEKMAQHPNFIEDVDDDFDCTYCTFFFTFPEVYATDLASIAGTEPFKPSKMWEDMIASINPPPQPEAKP